MNITKHYTRIENELFHKPWCILQSVHTTLVNGFKAYIKGEFKADMPTDAPMDMPEDDNCVEPAITNINGLAVVNIEGVIGKGLGTIEQCMGGCDLNAVSAQLKKCLADDNVTSILLYINSAGGTVTGTAETAELISNIDSVKPVYCYTDGQMCSAAYWLGSQCRAIFCSPSADVGSVGVYTILYDCSQAYINEGVKVNPIVNGKYKIMGADFQPLTDEQKAMFQADVDKIAVKFKSAVTSKRTIDANNLEGQVFDGEDAVKNNFCDGICNDVDEVISLITTK